MRSIVLTFSITGAIICLVIGIFGRNIYLIIISSAIAIIVPIANHILAQRASLKIGKEQKDLKERILIISKTMANNPAMENPFFQEASRLIKEGKDEQAVIEYERALEIDSNNVKLCIELGSVKSMQAIYEGFLGRRSREWAKLNYAMDLFKKAIKLNPKSKDALAALQGLGIALSQSGKNDKKAAEILEFVLQRDPKMPMLNANLGLVYLKLRRLKEAKEKFEKEVELYPGNPHAYFYLGNYYEAKDQLFLAFSFYKQTLDLQPEHGFVPWHLVKVLALLGAHAEALEKSVELLYTIPRRRAAFHRRIKIMVVLLTFSYAYLAIRTNLARILRKLKIGRCSGGCIEFLRYASRSFKEGNIDEAIFAFESATKVEPEYALTYANLSVLYYQKGLLEKSRTVAQKAIELCKKYHDSRAEQVAKKYFILAEKNLKTKQPAT